MKRCVTCLIVMILTIPSPFQEQTEAFYCVGVGITINILLAMIDDGALHFFTNGFIRLIPIGYQFRIFEINNAPYEPKVSSAGKVRCKLYYDFPISLDSLPMIASFSVPRPRLAGLSSSRLFGLRGLPPIQVSSASIIPCSSASPFLPFLRVYGLLYTKPFFGSSPNHAPSERNLVILDTVLCV